MRYSKLQLLDMGAVVAQECSLTVELDRLGSCKTNLTPTCFDSSTNFSLPVVSVSTERKTGVNRHKHGYKLRLPFRSICFIAGIYESSL